MPEATEQVAAQVDKKSVPQKIATILSEKGLSEKDAVFFSSLLCKHFPSEDREEVVKRFADAKSMKPHIGSTMEDDREDAPDHMHEFAMLVLNYGEFLVGVTTKTKKGKEHVHVISLCLDQKIKAVEAFTDYAITDESAESLDFHNHLFNAQIFSIRENIPSIYINSRYYSEQKELARGDGQGKGGPRQGDGGATKCVCPSCGEVASHEKGKPCSETKCPKCGTAMEGKSAAENSKRQAEADLMKAVQMSETPSMNQQAIEAFQESAYWALHDAYPESKMFEDILVHELAAKLDPNAKVRNRGTVVVPASQAKDKKDHFPINNANQARNALARVNQYKKAPTWWKGSLESLQKKVRSAVKKKYPKINVTGLSEHYAIRFKDEGSAFFIFSAATDIEMAKNDAYVYRSECPNYDIGIVKFVFGEDGANSFVEVGDFVFYDTVEGHKVITGGSENPIKLSDRDSDGNVVIEILRTGKFSHPTYGVFEISNNTLSEIQRNFRNRVLDRDVSFDFNHESDLPASAWVNKLSTVRRNVKGNMQQVLLAHVKFTPRGEEAVANADFRYFSSEFVDNFKDKENGKEFGTTLKGGGLTNRPFIPGLKPIELSEKKGLMGFIKN